jgi:sugar lactone lactonase YvrE
MGPKTNNNGFWRSFPASVARVRRVLAYSVAVSAFAAVAKADLYSFAYLAGNASVLDHTDGSGSNARFLNPSAVAVDAAGNIYVADSGDHTVRKVTTGGVVTTFAGTSGQAGSSDGAASGALFLYPCAVAVDAAGNVYVADSGNQNIREITAGGSVTTIAGTTGVSGSADGTGSAALFNQPQGIAVDATGNIYVSDTNNFTIRKIASGGVVTTLAGAAGQDGGSDGAGSSARFSYPIGIAVDGGGNIYVADYDNDAVRKVTPGGSVSTLAGSLGTAGSADGQGSAALFNHPEAVALDGAGNVYVIDTSNQTVREVTAGGSVTTLAGTPGMGGRADGAGAAARFFYPAGIASTGAGTVYVADTGNHAIREMASPGSVTTLAGSAGQEGDADGTGSQALFAYPHGVAVDGSGHIYIADTNNNAIRESTTAGVVTTLAGNGGVPPGSADGVGGAATFNAPAGVAADGNGNVYVADTGNNTIRKISAGGSVTTLAGQAGVAGSSDGTGSAAHFNSPQGIAVDTAGNIYVADTNNDTVRKITSGGTVTTLAGVAGQTGSGGGAGGSARFNRPCAVAVDTSGNVYVADFSNAVIRKIDLSDTVTTLAGYAGNTGFTDGDGYLARFNQPYALTVDSSGYVYVADTFNRAIREITPSGSVTTLNGLQSRFYYPQGIAVDGSGNLYVADGDNQAISMGAALNPPPSGTAISNESVTSGQNTSFTVSATGSSMTYQWRVSVDAGSTWSNISNNATYGGATTATLAITGATVSMSGDEYDVQLANPAGSSVSGAATLTVSAPVVVVAGGGTGSARIVNISCRAPVGTGGNILIVGFAVGGAGTSGTEPLLIRASGPALVPFGVSGTLSDPQLQLFSGSTSIATNDGWAGSAAIANTAAAVGAFPWPTSTSHDSALLESLYGAYTAQVAGQSGDTGVALAEVYDATPASAYSASSPRLVNISARVQVGTGSNVLIAGFVIGGTGTDTVLIRASGPALVPFGVTGTLPDPQLQLLSGSTVLGANTGWGGSSTISAAAAAVGAFPWTNLSSGDSALLITLPPGAYTAQVSGASNDTGVALVEVYEVN